MLEFVTGDFFDFEADIRVNTVNCIGVMGAGVALAFKKRYPDMFYHYAEQCKAGKVRPGQPSVWTNRDMVSTEVEIINFPTKNDWRNPSEYSYIEDGLIWLASYLKAKEGKVVTLPALGCGHGGLEWDIVRSLIEKYLGDTQAKVLVFEPSSSKNAHKKINDNLKNNSDFSSTGINIIEASSSIYPTALRRYTTKNLFVYSGTSNFFQYDFSLICSSKPAEAERLIIQSLMTLCVEYNISVLLGGTAYEKKLAFEYSQQGLKIACFLPTGIYESAKKLKKNNIKKVPTLLSIGNPFEAFDKKEYLPSVLSRIYLARKIFFLTDRLSWLSKYEKKLSKDTIQSYFFSGIGLTEEDVAAAINSGAKELTGDFFGNKAAIKELLP